MKKIKNNINKIYGVKMMTWAEDLFDYNRSLTGSGVRKTLNYFKKFLPELKIYSVKSGFKAFDWKVPNEWEIHEAYIEDLHGNRIIDFKENNLHVLGYSTSINKILSFKNVTGLFVALKSTCQF